MRASLRSWILYWSFMSIVLAQNAHVYLQSTDAITAPAATTASFEPATARLILAQHLGISQFHSLNRIEDEGIDALNQFFVEPQPLSASPSPKILLFMEDLASVQDKCVSLKQSLGFDILDAPSFDANTLLLDDFIAQVQYTNNHNSFTAANTKLNQILSDTLGRLNPATAKFKSSVEGGVAIARLFPGEENSHITNNSAICQALDVLSTLARAKNCVLTVAIFSRRDTTNNKVERDAFSWGTYATPFVPPTSRQEFENASQNPNAEESPGITYTFFEPEEKTTSSPLSTASTAPPPGILPSRYSSRESCESATNFCSGRGSCEVRQNYTENNDEKKSYACVCRTETRRNAEGGTKTIVWGGPACQKRDIGVEFWLLGGFTLLFVGILTWALGMLYTMGQEELPSVIGAGVAGPRVK